MSLLRVANIFPIDLAAPRSGKPHGSKEVPRPNLDSRLTPVPRLPLGFDAKHMASLGAEREEKEPTRSRLTAPSWLGVGFAPKSVSKPPQRHEDHVRNECALRT